MTKIKDSKDSSTFLMTSKSIILPSQDNKAKLSFFYIPSLTFEICATLLPNFIKPYSLLDSQTGDLSDNLKYRQKCVKFDEFKLAKYLTNCKYKTHKDNPFYFMEEFSVDRTDRDESSAGKLSSDASEYYFAIIIKESSISYFNENMVTLLKSMSLEENNLALLEDGQKNYTFIDDLHQTFVDIYDVEIDVLTRSKGSNDSALDFSTSSVSCQIDNSSNSSSNNFKNCKNWYSTNYRTEFRCSEDSHKESKLCSINLMTNCIFCYLSLHADLYSHKLAVAKMENQLDSQVHQKFLQSDFVDGRHECGFCRLGEVVSESDLDSNSDPDSGLLDTDEENYDYNYETSEFSIQEDTCGPKFNSKQKCSASHDCSWSAALVPTEEYCQSTLSGSVVKAGHLFVYS